MTSKPKAGSKGYYPRVRAKSIIPKFDTFSEEKDVKILNFFGYKAGMNQVFGTNKHKGSPYHGMKVKIPVTVL
jgi:large subunit ribosomal protein L3